MTDDVRCLFSFWRLSSPKLLPADNVPRKSPASSLICNRYLASSFWGGSIFKKALRVANQFNKAVKVSSRHRKVWRTCLGTRLYFDIILSECVKSSNSSRESRFSWSVADDDDDELSLVDAVACFPGEFSFSWEELLFAIVELGNEEEVLLVIWLCFMAWDLKKSMGDLSKRKSKQRGPPSSDNRTRSLSWKEKRGPSMDGDYDSDDVAYKQCHQLEQRYTSERSILGAIGIVQVASSLFLLTAILPGIFGPSLLENAAGTPDDDVHLIPNVILSNNPIVSWHLLSFFGESVNRLITKTTQQDSAIFDTAAAFWSVVQTFCNTIHIIIYLPWGQYYSRAFPGSSASAPWISDTCFEGI